MAETLLKRQLGESLVDISVVLFLFLLRVSINTLCVKYNRRMSGNASSSTDDEFPEFGELPKQQQQQLPHLKSASEIFAGFLEQVDRIFPLLIHVSICLFPRDFVLYSRPEKFPKLPQSTPGDTGANTVRQFVDKVLSFRFMNQLDWTNCCVFQLQHSRGPVVQNPPPWTVSCTAAFHAAFVKREMVQSRDYDRYGPHFADWTDLRRKRNAHSMVAVPLYSRKQQLIAVLGMASTAKNAFHCDEMVFIMASFLAPYVDRLLSFSTRKMELQKIVSSILCPIASHMSQCSQLKSSESSPSFKDTMSSKTNTKRRMIKVRAPRLIKEASMRVICGNGHTRVNGNASTSEDMLPLKDQDGSSTLPSNLRIIISDLVFLDLIFCVSCLSKQGGGSSGYGFYSRPVTEQSINWGDCILTIVNLLFVYVYLNKVAVRGHSWMALFLCIGVWIFEFILLQIIYLLLGQSGNQGPFIVGICQIYRVIVIPVANTWMAWRVLDHLELQPDSQHILLLSLCLLICILLGSRFRFLLQVPIQMLSIILAAISTPDICHRFVPISVYPFICIGIVITFQVCVAYLIPTLLARNFESLQKNPEMSFRNCPCLPHMQTEHVSY